MYELRSDQLRMRVTPYGGIILSLEAPGRDGRWADVVLGFDSPDDYDERSPYFGAIIGRYANRIAGARFTLDGRAHLLAANNGPHHLHGGRRGFDKRDWTVERADGAELWLSLTSEDGEEGYPGTLRVTARYALSGGDVGIAFEATADRATPLNLTQHTYFNLAGEGDVHDHELMIAAATFLPADATLIPTGERASVSGTPFDFREPRAVGGRIGEPHPQLRVAGGYDHTFVLEPGASPAARLHHPASGRTLEVRTTEPGLQLYTGNFLDGSLRGKGGARYGHRAGLCLETQHFPDAPNRPGFPPAIVRPGETYRSRTTWTFGVGGQRTTS